MNRKIFGGIFGVSIMVLVLSLALLMGVIYEYFSAQYEDQIKNEANYIAAAIEEYGESYIDSLDEHLADLDDTLQDSSTDSVHKEAPVGSLFGLYTKDNAVENRITWIDEDGSVIYDSAVDAKKMENHLDREEVQEAIKNGSGESTRYSSTLSEMTLYYAVSLDDGTVLRIAVTRHTVFSLLVGILWPALVILVLAVIFSAIIAMHTSKRIVEPINDIDLERPLESDVYEELTPFLKKISNQNSQIRNQIEELGRKQAEFEMITENMSEGFIIIDEKTEVLSYNTSALTMLGAEDFEAGQSIYTLNRSAALRQVVDQGLLGKHHEEILERAGRAYSIIANPVTREGEGVAGMVIVILDVTEKEAANQMRREFTANVSHELKTPLTSIMGYAEIMKSGIAKPDDMTHFSETIYNEASRLLDLIGDIMQLSKLDEKKELAGTDELDLKSAVDLVVERVENLAQKNDIALLTGGESASVNAPAQLLDEVIFNLVENAIKYNKPGGYVSITTGSEDGRAYFVVEDSGIGISEEDQPRVFERFYRADKAHSREIGGTGLGLSIVKHAVDTMGADILLESKLGKGTTIKVVFS